jgi:hypothetical protein
MSQMSKDELRDLMILLGGLVLFIFGLMMIWMAAARAQMVSIAPTDHEGGGSYTLTLSVREINVIEAGLNELPRKMAEPLIQAMIVQIRAEIASKAKADAEAIGIAEQKKSAAAAKEREDYEAKVRTETEAKVRAELSARPDGNGNIVIPK